MNATTFLGLERVGDERWRLPVVPALCTPGGFLFGGCGLGAAVAALEGTTGRPVVWATAQYLSYARPPGVMEIDVTIAVAGHSVTQARAVGRVDGDEILTVNAALGARPSELAGEWAIRPDVLAPDLCPTRPLHQHHTGTIMDRLEQRLAAGRVAEQLDGRPGTGRCALWVRMPELIEVSGPGLAILGDYVPFGIGQALGIDAGGNSLDNTLRVINCAPSEWILLDIRVHGISQGFGHGLVHLWSEGGALLATASQSTIVRVHDRRRWDRDEP